MVARTASGAAMCRDGFGNRQRTVELLACGHHFLHEPQAQRRLGIRTRHR